jgi:hypothetical protein
MVRSWSFVAALVLGSLALTLSGCGKTDVPGSASGDTKGDAHAHKPSAHGGIIVPLGSDSYHAEAVFEKNGVVRLYTLGADESRVMEVDAEPVQAFVKAEGDTEAESIVLRPQPQAGDTKGKTSQFVGHIGREKWGKKVSVTIPNFTIGKERFRLNFSNTQDDHGVVQPMAAADEKKLYLEPGGIYTAADIKANGNMVASQKFQGLRAEHDMQPKPGDKICPITETKANPKFTWVVGGQTYEFCCPPCVDEFVGRAKQDPKLIKAPTEYVQGAKPTPKPQDPDEATIQAERKKLNPEDRKLVEAQEWCVATEERLGSMGAPIKLMVKDQPVFVCCKGCQRKTLANPDATLATVKQLKAKKQAELSSK